MMELPEAVVLAGHLALEAAGRTVVRAVAASSPHKFAFYYGDPAEYAARIEGRVLGTARSVGGYVEVEAEDASLLLGEGVNVRLFGPGAARPQKHQLLLDLDDGSSLVCTVRMYGGMWLYPRGSFDNKYYLLARDAVFLFGPDFESHFRKMAASAAPGLGLKAFLATEQRIPGLGNGVLQDILFSARLNPRTRIGRLDSAAIGRLHGSVVAVMADMAARGGRDTEKNLYGQPGGYTTVMAGSKLTIPCPACGGCKKKETLLGGTVYYCPVCQPE